MKLRAVRLNGLRLPESRESILGDVAWETELDTTHVGTITENGFAPLASGNTVQIEFHAYPDPVTIDSDVLPLTEAHAMLLWRLKGQLYSERREWDKAGYYNRRYDRSLVEYRRMINSSGPQRSLQTNTEFSS